MRSTLLAAAACAFAIPATAQTLPIVDDFDSYQAGSGIAGQGAWDAWDGDLAFDSFVSTTVANSGANSLEIVGDSDTIIPFTDKTNGCYEIGPDDYGKADSLPP